MMRRRRDAIERFCRTFLQGNDHQLHKLITNDRQVLSQIDVQQMQFTKDTFDGLLRPQMKKKTQMKKKLYEEKITQRNCKAH